MISIKNYFFTTLVIALLFTSCVPSPKKLENAKSESELAPLAQGYSIIFFNLDNYALVYVDGEMVFDTRTSTTQTNHEVLLNLNMYIKNNKQELKVEGYNDKCEMCAENRWEIVYELYKNGESVDYVNKDSNDKHDTPGLKFTQFHKLASY
ncbi:hypothetical protein N6H18_11160 [Reichenbachiella agarivorans]|uniref:NlpE N-terminal domain-containing protein n=1 Tax=Reichenbachiella agarivorans TaxID=2979464 RepID=A0ABY6CK62_9BACT|nr:hypothetical protein [Reichenbachiella agarivorans]UXP30909.1 hypothetical protein N6H18_11160 [Reichenbachiella agarivorans]